MYESESNIKICFFCLLKWSLPIFWELFSDQNQTKEEKKVETVSVSKMILRDRRFEKMNLRTANKLDGGPSFVDTCIYTHLTQIIFFKIGWRLPCVSHSATKQSIVVRSESTSKLRFWSEKSSQKIGRDHFFWVIPHFIYKWRLWRHTDVRLLKVMYCFQWLIVWTVSWSD